MATRIREKAIARQKNADPRAYAVVKYVRMSPSKVRITLDTIRGKKVEEAIAILSNQTTAAAEVCLKLVKSALANAENNKGLAAADLFFAQYSFKIEKRHTESAPPETPATITSPSSTI